jgi:hypothetical protein
MAIFVERPDSPALLRRCAEIEARLRPGSKEIVKFREDLRLVVTEDHYHMLLENRDRYGQTRAPLAARTLADPKRGPGPSLIPNYYRSRFLSHFEALWTTEGALMILIARYRDILSKKGKPFVQYHMTGTWKMPRRDTGGITPKGWAQVKKLFAILPTYILRKGGGSSGP